MFYIGKGTNANGRYVRSFEKRYRNQHWHNVVNKHGFKIEIVIENVTEKEANEKEVELILYYGRRDLGTGTLVNMTNGGEGTCGRTVSKETRKKISDSNRGKVRSEEARKKMCGKIHTEEHRRKNGDGNRGKKRTEEARKKISDKQPKKRVGQYKDGILVKEYPFVNSVSLDGYSTSAVSSCCNGKRNHHKGFQWKFL